MTLRSRLRWNRSQTLFVVISVFVLLSLQAGGAAAQVIPRTNWSLKFVDSQELVGENGAAVNSFDGNTGTIWHTQWLGSSPPPPHEIQINLGAVYTISGFRYLPRQDGGTNGRIKQYEFYVSSDGTNWGTAAATGTFANNATEKSVSFASRTGQFVRLRALSEVNGGPWTSMAELNVVGTAAGNQAPNGTISTPSSDVTISVGGTINFTGSGSDPDNNLPLSYRWSFGSGSGVPDSTAQNPGVVQFNNPGTFTVTFTVTDGLGLADPVPAARIVTVGAAAIPQTNWTLTFVDSQELVGENGAAVNAFDGNASTFWHTQWLNASPPPPHEIQINLGAVYNISGFRYLPRQDGSTHGWINQYEFYVSSDGTNWGSAAATGTFANSATEKSVSFASRTGQFVRLRALSEINGGPWTSMAELNVVGTATGNQPPNGVISTPSSDVTISVGGTVNFTGSGSDPNNNLPLSYRWSFGSGSGVPDSTAQNPGVVQFNNPGTFTVTFTVTDSLGLADPTPATRIVAVGAAVAIPQTNWTLKFVDSQELVGENGAAVNSFDGNAGTIWHTQWSGSSPPPPHEIQINLGAVYNISGFRYLPRQDGSNHGWIGQYEFYVSSDGTNWGSAAATGTFANNATEKLVSFASRPGQFVRLRALSEVNGGPWTSMAELNVVGQCIPPSVDIVQPQFNSLQTATSVQVLASACLDSVANSGWGVRFTLDGGSSFDTHTPPFQGVFTNVSRAEHVIDAFIIDGAGNQVSGSATHDQVTHVGVGDYFVAMGDSITVGVFDDMTSDNTSADGRNTGGGYEPVLNDLRTTAKGYPQTVINEGIGGTSSIDGVSLIPTLVSKHPNAQRFLIGYGTNDAGGPVPSGLGLHPGDGGYPGTFKDNMQRIIAAVKNAGKVPHLAKIPASIGAFAGRNSLYQTYNQVIDELVAENAGTVVGPDFFSWFNDPAHQNQFSSDGLHPNGVGYHSMGTLWFNALP
jgi:lysophospholipase L1-like esterase